MSKEIMKEDKITISKDQSCNRLSKSYAEFWNCYMENMMEAFSFEAELFKYLLTNASDYFSSLISFYASLNRMGMMLSPLCTPFRVSKSG